MPIRTRRWNDPPEPGEGLRILVCRYRPRGVKKTDETWDEWMKDLAPSVELHADYYGKTGDPIGYEEYEPRYLAEMKKQKMEIEALAREVAAGGAITLLCSSACVDPAKCHRTLLKGLVGEAAKRFRP